jgi:hypothetical protein
MVKRTASLQVIQRDARSSWSSTQLWPTRGVTNTAQDNSVLNSAFVLLDTLSQVTLGGLTCGYDLQCLRLPRDSLEQYVTNDSFGG